MMPRRKGPPLEDPEQEIERFAGMLRASMIDATATLARLVELSGSKRGRRELITSYILDELNDDLNTVASLAAILYGLGLKHADIPKNPLKQEESQNGNEKTGTERPQAHAGGAGSPQGGRESVGRGNGRDRVPGR